MTKTVKYNLELLTTFCNDNHITLLNNYSEEVVNRKTRINGKCLTKNCINIFDKTFRQLYQINGYCKECSMNIKTNKFKVTCLEKYGVENSFQSQEVKDKIKKTCLKNYGVENSFQSQEVKDKIKKTNLEKYGVEHPLQSQEVIDKIKKTCLEKYGVENSFQSQEVKDKIKKTCLKNYGVEHPQQNPEIAERTSKTSYSRKDYTFPSGKIISVQGYEPYALNELVKIFNENEIKTGTINVPEIWYDNYEGIKHRHFVDIFIPSKNKCIEVKSTWTAKKKKDNIFKKQQSGKELGFTYEIWIYNSKGEKVECII